MTLLLATAPILLLFALFFLDIYVFRSQWKDGPHDPGGDTRAISRPPKVPAEVRHKRAAIF
jgi:hypothetical protein